MRHYCTYFDRGFLIQGLALWRSLARHDPDSVLWVLALDDFTAEVLCEVGGTWMRVVRLAELETGDAELVAAKANRTPVEYFFTLTPCWPRWLMAKYPEIELTTYVDADMFFFGSPEPIFDAMDAASASVLITPHRFPAWLRHYERHGKFNVGILSFRNDSAGRGCLDDWRKRCLEWCYDRLEAGKYADQKYLDAWPSQLGAALLVLDDASVNLAPWNWTAHYIVVDTAGRVKVGGCLLVLFHFARFRPECGDWLWHSGQLDYGVMPWSLRNAIYKPYIRALLSAREEIKELRPCFESAQRPRRAGRELWRALPLRILFGSDWLWLGGRLVSGRLGLGRWSGQFLAKLRTIFLRA